MRNAHALGVTHSVWGYRLLLKCGVLAAVLWGYKLQQNVWGTGCSSVAVCIVQAV